MDALVKAVRSRVSFPEDTLEPDVEFDVSARLIDYNDGGDENHRTMLHFVPIPDQPRHLLVVRGACCFLSPPTCSTALTSAHGTGHR